MTTNMVTCEIPWRQTCLAELILQNSASSVWDRQGVSLKRLGKSSRRTEDPLALCLSTGLTVGSEWRFFLSSVVCQHVVHNHSFPLEGSDWLVK